MLCDTRSEADDNASKLRRAGAISMVRSKGVAALAEAFLPSIVSSPAGLAEAKRIAAKNGPIGICGSLLAMASRTDTTESLSKISVPTLVLAGEKDALTPPEMSRAMAARIPGARCEIITGAGHLSNLDRPDEFNKLLLEFASRLN
jgi:pimeloyl-ACP methyl ester carboxylesterase